MATIYCVPLQIELVLKTPCSSTFFTVLDMCFLTDHSSTSDPDIHRKRSLPFQDVIHCILEHGFDMPAPGTKPSFPFFLRFISCIHRCFSLYLVIFLMQWRNRWCSHGSLVMLECSPDYSKSPRTKTLHLRMTFWGTLAMFFQDMVGMSAYRSTTSTCQPWHNFFWRIRTCMVHLRPM
jgi:hypothetical protein